MLQDQPTLALALQLAREWKGALPTCPATDGVLCDGCGGVNEGLLWRYWASRAERPWHYCQSCAVDFIGGGCVPVNAVHRPFPFLRISSSPSRQFIYCDDVITVNPADPRHSMSLPYKAGVRCWCASCLLHTRHCTTLDAHIMSVGHREELRAVL